MRVMGKIALVTGARGGIGTACARMLSDEGAEVFRADLPHDGDERGGNFLPLDVTSAGDWARTVAHIVDRHGRIDVLVHCAGIEGSHERGLDTTETDWNRVLGVNLTGTFLGCKAVFGEMLKRKEGSVIILASAITDMATSGALAYGASKAGATHLARSFAAIGSQDGAKIRCNTVHPGSIRSRMSDSMFAAIAKTADVPFEAIEARVKQAIPFGDRGEPEDIAQLVLYLASDESRYATGCQFKVDGGWSLKSAG
ncbi:hypothetical protein ASE00_01435 [Sphingomonas sp. Root710]|uniref:SDR family NAD(P)-dependent oxidoreductase n=1 Tax=Sphingomonas sp. Root710 TaxID=1736594 RepID=UPI0006F9975F|nr:SDR family oxidoreductase [Sphingomonas sp. Root710]KRB85486.1 hypothetical protein ASE00_01435 [Sphingomonas sp. Root710]